MLHNRKHGMLTKKQILFHRELLLKFNLECKNLNILLQNKIWPKLEKKHKFLLGILQKHICLLSLKGEDNIAFKLLNQYSFSTLIRIIAINKVIFFYKQCKWNLYLVKLYFIILKLNRKILQKKILFSFNLTIFIDKILQTQFCFLLDAFYEAKYPVLMFGSRKGRYPLYAVSFLYTLLKTFGHFKSFGLIYVKLNLTNFVLTQKSLLKLILLPKKWYNCFLYWSQSFLFLIKNKIHNLNILFQKKFLVFSLIITVLLARGLLEHFSFFFYNFLDGFSFYRFILIYNNLIIIVTNRTFELFYILEIFRKALFFVGISLHDFSYNLFFFNSKQTSNFFSFNFLGFTYKLYWRPFNLNKRKLEISIAITASIFKQIKFNCKKIILFMGHMSFMQILYFLNKYLFSVANYFAFDFNFIKLKQLDAWIFFFIKKYLIKKYRLKGIRRPRWVIKNFLSLFHNTFFYKIYKSKPWHPFGLLINKSSTLVPKYKIIFLVLTSCLFKRVSLIIYFVPYMVYFTPFYLKPSIYIENFWKIKKQRSLKF